MLHGAGIFTNICTNNDPNVGEYSIHGTSGIVFENLRYRFCKGDKSTISEVIFHSYVTHSQRVVMFMRFSHWPLQEPKLDVSTIYKAYF